MLISQGYSGKKMPERTYVSKFYKSTSGHKAAKDRITIILCSNTSGDYIMKPLVINNSKMPRAFKGVNINNLPAWVTAAMFTEWFHECFIPDAKKYLSSKGLPFKVLLLIDNAPGHPQDLQGAFINFQDWIRLHQQKVKLFIMRFYFSMDFQSGFWQIDVEESDREKTAFIILDRLYEFKVMPFGLFDAPATFERMMDNRLEGLKWTICLYYLNDIISFLGFSSYYRRFIPNYSYLSQPMNDFLEKYLAFYWKREHQEFKLLIAFEKVGMDLLGRFPTSDSGNRWIIVCRDYLTKYAITKALLTSESMEIAKCLIEEWISWGRFPTSDSGNRWIIVCRDYLTKYAITKALLTSEYMEIAKCLIEDVILKHGAPRELITDRERNFTSLMISDLNNQCRITHRKTTAYQPRQTDSRRG
ncbi:hypothetical protein LAZ67_11001452 [Cordylochernes scorpioides]|uniref:Integrase catalytic domain-containing protein n=1 Tax=Cordylochernes scorpioides TaxID=51811 RepID=A0ABY6L175_9ARAC|nr:hypothetical protein LAZ67_11001452 [Cordylochernes scorpioides]